jgi:hypothetical protein
MNLDIRGRVLDRRASKDRQHIDKYPLGAVLAAEPIPPFEKLLDVPRQYRADYDQGHEGACVGFSQSWMMSILNRKLYDAHWLYQQAQLVDEWPSTPPEEGTSLRAAFDILRTKGHRRVYAGVSRPVEEQQGIAANRWATTIDEIRAAIHGGIPVNFGINWYQQFSNPFQEFRLDDYGKPITEFGIIRYDWYIGRGYWGRIAGGHAITCIGVSDKRQAFALCNTWGDSYPFLVWLPYAATTRLLSEDGEAGVVVDR